MPSVSTSSQQYPLSDATYDIISVLYQKSQSIEHYRRFLDDVRNDTRLTQLLVQIKHDDERHIELLKTHLGRLLTTDMSPSRAKQV